MPVSVNFDPLAERMRKIRASQDLLARLSGLPAMSISRAVNHQEDLCYADWRRVEGIIADLEEIVRRSPIQPDWKNYESVKANLADLESERRNPPSPPSTEDWALLSLVQTMNDPARIATNMGCTLTELSAKIEAANARFEFAVNQMSRWSQDAKNLAAANEIEHEERRFNQGWDAARSSKR